MSYKRIDSNRLEEIRSDIKKKEMERKENLQKCENLKKEFSDKLGEITEQTKDDWGKRTEEVTMLRKRFSKKSGDIPDCYIISF